MHCEPPWTCIIKKSCIHSFFFFTSLVHLLWFQVAIKKGCVQAYHTDTWFPLVHVEPDTEVQGRIHLEIKHYEFIPDTDDDEFSNTPKLSIRYVSVLDFFWLCNNLIILPKILNNIIFRWIIFRLLIIKYISLALCAYWRAETWWWWNILALLFLNDVLMHTP